ncbi:uncharacterized protein LOC116573401 isoform X3 [Mustela erminea]|uniref:uncharacterized protein LOC116573401 isoform X3 n=1 Tax=Mustela erminea TaxID=36723 RepID=UPI0013866AC8|nr:uncharacterized protein LOC116573401 isoform X3 [Mustela erminea]
MKQAAPLPGLALHQPHFPVGESDLHGAGEDRQLGEEGHRLGARGHQRHALRAVCCLPLRLSLQNLEDVLGQHLLGVKGILRSAFGLCKFMVSSEISGRPGPGGQYLALPYVAQRPRARLPIHSLAAGSADVDGGSPQD